MRFVVIFIPPDQKTLIKNLAHTISSDLAAVAVTNIAITTTTR